MPKDEWGNIISEAEYDRIYHSSGETYTSKDEFGNIVKKDDLGNELVYDPKSGKSSWVKTD